MHRDLKPENIMLADKFLLHKIKIIDFGLGAFIDKKPWIYKRCGTPGYVAPEVYEKGLEMGYGEKCDIFSAGVIFYFLFSFSSH